MRPESRLAGLVWDALEFSRNAQIAVGEATVAEFLEGGVVPWATERQIELVGEALSKLRQAAPEIAERCRTYTRSSACEMS